MAQSTGYAELLMGAGMAGGLARVVAVPFEVAPINALPGTNIDRLPTVPIWGAISPEANIAMNIYLDAESRWRYLANGPGAIFRLVKEPPAFEIQVVPVGAKGELVTGWTLAFNAPIPPAQEDGAAAAAAVAAAEPEPGPPEEPHGRSSRRRR